MSYTILSAAYGDETHEHAILQTAEFGAVSISERDRPELWEQMIAGPVSAYVPPPAKALPSAPPPQTEAEIAAALEAARALYLAKVDADANTALLKYVAEGDGLGMMYREKFEQANAVNSMGEEAANGLSREDRDAQFPTLAARVGMDAPTLWQCAQLVIARYAEFVRASGPIERLRGTAKNVIRSAATIEAIITAYDAVRWEA